MTDTDTAGDDAPESWQEKLSRWDNAALSMSADQVGAARERLDRAVRDPAVRGDPFKVAVSREDLLAVLRRGEWPAWDDEVCITIPAAHSVVTHTPDDGDPEVTLLRHVSEAFNNIVIRDLDPVGRVRVLRYLLDRETAT